MVDADLLADFDLESGSEKDFFMEQLRIAPLEEVDILLSSVKHTAKPTAAVSARTPANKTDEATQSLLKLEIADFAQKRAAAIPEGIPSKEQLDNFKEEVYMYGIGLNLGEAQALLAAAKAEADVVKSRSMTTMKGQLAFPRPSIEAGNKTMEQFTKTQDVVGELVKDVPQSQARTKAATVNTPMANKRKRSRPFKGGAEAAKVSAPTASVSEAACKRQKTSPASAIQAAPVTTIEPAIAETDGPKLTRKQKQELYRQGLENKRPVIASKTVSPIASTAPTTTKPVDTTAVVPTSAPAPAQSPIVPSQPAQKTRQRARKSAAQKQLEKAAKTVDKAPAAVAASSAGPKAPDAEADGFIDVRGPKKKRRGRKSTATSEVVTEKDSVLEAASVAATVQEKEVVVADKPAAAPSDVVSSIVAVQDVIGEGEKDKNKSKRQNKINKRKSLGDEPVSTAIAASTAVATPLKSVQGAAHADKQAAVKQTPIPPPSRAILPPQQSSARPSSTKAAPAKTATPATSIPPPCTAPILPPSSVSKLVLQKSPAVTVTSAPILPGATPKAASSTPLTGISAPNSSSKGRKRGPRKSDVAAVVNADEPKENHL